MEDKRNLAEPGESNLPSQATAPTEPTTYENGYLRGLLARLYLISRRPKVGLEELKLEVSKTYDDAMRGP